MMDLVHMSSYLDIPIHSYYASVRIYRDERKKRKERKSLQETSRWTVDLGENSKFYRPSVARGKGDEERDRETEE